MRVKGELYKKEEEPGSRDVSCVFPGTLPSILYTYTYIYIVIRGGKEEQDRLEREWNYI